MAELKTGGLIINETISSGYVDSAIIDSRKAEGFGLTYKWAGDLEATLALYCMNDGNTDTPDIGWVPVNNITFSGAVDGSGGVDEDSFATSYHRYYKVRVTRTAGSGLFQMVLNV